MGGNTSWRSSFQKMAVPVMAIRASDPGAVDDQEDKWAQAVYWNELMDKIEELPDAGTFIQTYSMAVVARGKSRIPQCYRCGDRGHMRDKCTYTEDVCYRCKLAGHKSESCTGPL